MNNKKETIEEINERISQLVNYGVQRHIVKPNDQTLICWSNGKKGWYINGMVTKENIQSVKHHGIGCNELIINLTKNETKVILKDLAVLPLYHNSFESRSKHVFNRNFK